jgi:hypothetical protein
MGLGERRREGTTKEMMKDERNGKSGGQGKKGNDGRDVDNEGLSLTLTLTLTLT